MMPGEMQNLPADFATGLSGGGDVGPSGGKDAKMEQVKKQQEEMNERKRVMVRSMLEAEAFERLNRIALVKPERAQQIEMMLIQNGPRFAGTGKISDAQFLNLLDGMTGNEDSRGPTVKISRKARGDESDQDW